MKFKNNYKCLGLGCKESFDELKEWEEHNKSCGAIGYELLKQRVIETNKSIKNIIKHEPTEPTLKQADLTNKDNEKLDKLLNKESKTEKKESKTEKTEKKVKKTNKSKKDIK